MKPERSSGPILLAAVTLLSLWSCGGKAPPSQQRSQRERDSILAKSRLPGATGVGAALRLSDSADARRRREDSIARNP